MILLDLKGARQGQQASGNLAGRTVAQLQVSNAATLRDHESIEPSTWQGDLKFYGTVSHLPSNRLVPHGTATKRCR
jgi:hypothetical protein